MVKFTSIVQRQHDVKSHYGVVIDIKSIKKIERYNFYLIFRLNKSK